MDGPNIKETLQQFAQRIKSKHPEYQDLDDNELAERTLRKHPAYADNVELPEGFSFRGDATSGYPNLDKLYEDAGRKHNVDARLLIAQGRKETAFKPDVIYGRTASRNAQGKVIGARGSGQFMPGTADRFDVDVNDPASGINGQAEYMRKLLDMFDGDESLALAGYNAGEGNVTK
jgi:soluble lytic murein transglycosylase-like protein